MSQVPSIVNPVETETTVGFVHNASHARLIERVCFVCAFGFPAAQKSG